LTGGDLAVGLSSLAMATVGMIATHRLVSRAKRAGNFARNFAGRRLNLVFATLSVGAYSVQFAIAAALVAVSHNAALQRALVLMLVVLYGSALGRAWEVTGITRRQIEERNPDADPGATLAGPG